MYILNGRVVMFVVMKNYKLIVLVVKSPYTLLLALIAKKTDRRPRISFTPLNSNH